MPAHGQDAWFKPLTEVPLTEPRWVRAVEFDKVMKDGFDSGELERTKKNLEGNLVLSLEGMSSRMMRMSRNEMNHGREIPIEETLEKMKLKAGGKFVMTVPAHPWMWSAHDLVNHHKRRYSKRALRALIEGSPLHLEKIGYFNSLLFPAALAERLSSKLRGKDNAELTLPPTPLNAVLEWTFAAERHLIGRLPLPPGLSLFAVASAR